MDMRRMLLREGLMAICIALLAACNNDNNPAMNSSSSGGTGTSSSSSSSGSSSSSSGAASSSSSSSSSSSGSSSSSSSGAAPSTSAYTVTNLVADTAGLAANGVAPATRVDAKLVNPWGLVFGATGPVWISDNGSQSSTLYDGEGAAPRGPVAIPAGTSGDADPSGIVHNPGTTDFVVSKAGVSAAAVFIFDGEGGSLSGWSPTVDANNAVTVYNAADGAVYKGLAVAQNAGANFLYATDFHNAKVDVFDKTFAKVSNATTFTFKDPGLPAGYAPFGIAALTSGGTTRIYVAFARQQAGSGDEADGAGLGLVDVFDTAGVFVKTLIPAGGVLNAPWGLAMAPSDFGSASNDLLVGNFGDGRINVFNPATGALVAVLANPAKQPLALNGLWGIGFGNDASGLDQPHNTLFFTAGTNGEANGSYGRIDLGPDPPDFKPSAVITAPAAAASVSGTVNFMVQAGGPFGIAKVEFFVNSHSLGSVTTSPYHLSWDTTTAANGTATLTATVTDVDGNTNTADAVTVTVANAAAHTTLTQLQQQFFTPICSSCHNGVGNFLPGSQNLTAGNSFSNIVNVASVEQPSLVRIKPNDAANSYMVQKIQGASGISGSRMPLGCPTSQPCLTQAQINEFIDWVNAGALNN